MILDLLTYILFVLVCAGLWRLGGGAFTTLSGFELGTDEARVFRAVPAWSYLLAFWPSIPSAFAALALYVGVMCVGWAPFQNMGLPPENMPEQSWLRWLPEHLGLKIGTLGHDFVGMMEAGLVCVAPLAALTWFIAGPQGTAILLAAGLGFAPCYLLARLNFPSVPNFAEGQSWGEVFTGALIGAALGLIIFTSAGWSFL
jgi:hypothetical protein